LHKESSFFKNKLNQRFGRSDGKPSSGSPKCNWQQSEAFCSIYR